MSAIVQMGKSQPNSVVKRGKLADTTQFCIFLFPYTLSSPSLSKQAVITLILFVRREPNPSTICAKKVESTPNMFSLNNTQRRNRFGLYLTCRNLNLIKFSVLFFFLQQEGGSPGGSPPCDNHFTSPLKEKKKKEKDFLLRVPFYMRS